VQTWEQKQTKQMKTSTFEVLSKIDCSKNVEKKNGLTYLSWSWAWAIVKVNYPDANYTVREWDGMPYLHDPILGYLVQTEVTINNETIGIRLPVMDGANKAQRHEAYTYEVANYEYQNGKKVKVGTIKKTVEAATMFDINTAIMRCLTKNLALFGLGHYIYAGEDLPKQIESEHEKEEAKAKIKAELEAKANEPKPMTDKQFEAIKNLLNSDKKEEQERGVKGYELFLKPPYTMTEAQKTELSQIYNFLKA
jgi:hypothetical protein